VDNLKTCNKKTSGVIHVHTGHMVVQHAKCSTYDKSPVVKYHIHLDKAQHKIKIMTESFVAAVVNHVA